jgi:hypothetical protein
MPTGGTSTGGNSGSRGSYPCDGDTSGYNAVATQSGGSWTVTNGGNTVYTGSDMESAMVAAYDSLSGGRSSKESVLIQGSGDVSANAQISIPSYTIVNVCGTINVTGSGSGDRSPMHARGATDIEVPNVTITGAPVYAMFFRETNNVHLGNIVLDLDSSAGRGLRIDHSSSSGPGKPYFGNYQIDSVHVSGSGGHGVETYGIENITIGEVVAENTGYCGLLLNYTRDAEVGSVTGNNCGAGTGYAAFRIANQAGPNIHVGEVVARNGGRGIFSVSESGGLTVDRVDIADTGSNAILLEDCHDTTIAAESGTVAGPGDIRIAGASSNVTVQNLTVVDSAVNENPCGSNITVQNNTYDGSSENVCN